MIKQFKKYIKIFRFYIVFLVCKVLYFYYSQSEKFNKNRNFLTWNFVLAEIILRYCYDFLQNIRTYCRNDVVTISGTNGKSTVAGLIANMLSSDGKKVVYNKEGSNVIRGILAKLAGEVPLFKKVDNFVLEVDESNLRKIFPQMPAEYLVLTNLFPDPVCSDGLNTIIERMQEGLKYNPNVKLVINADDPTLTVFKSHNIVRYGVNNIIWNNVSSEYSNVFEAKKCFSCGKDLEYKKNFYSTIGHYCCECGNSRVTPDIEANFEICELHSNIEVHFKNQTYKFHVGLKGIHNAYNALAAISLALLLNIDPERIQCAINTYSPMFGRGDELNIRGKKLSVNLVKNASGLTVVLNSLNIKPNDIIFIAANHKLSDGCEVSWFDRVDLSKIVNTDNKIVVSGEQNEEIRRILIAHNKNEEQIITEPDVINGVKLSLNLADKCDKIHTLIGFSALTQLETFIKEKS